VNGALYGRGSTDDKGPVLGWINSIEAMQEKGMEVPINVKVPSLYYMNLENKT